MEMQALYYHLPVCMQEWVLCRYARYLDRLYYGPSFDEWAVRFSMLESMTEEQIRAHQQKSLRHILRSAFFGVPWFHALGKELNMSAEEILTLDELRCLPIMEKEPLRQDPIRFLREDYPRQWLIPQCTSGTTGTSLRILWPREMFPRWWALHEVRVRRWAGVGQNMPRAMIGGRPIISGNANKPPYWRYNRHWRQLYMSSYHISPSTAPAYIEALRRYGSYWITGYGSAIALLGDYLTTHPEELLVKAVLTSGDTMTDKQRKTIEKGFGCRVFDHYASSEGCCVISECQYGRLHLQPEAGILEIIDENGNPCPPEVEGEFICTGLSNDVMPLIRYRTGDYGAWSSERDCSCGRHSQIVSHISGRTDDYLILNDGRRIGRLSTAMKKAPSVKQSQIVQDKIDHAWLLVVPDETYRREDGMVLVEDILSRIGSRSITIDVREVTAIPPTQAGKHVLVRRIFDRQEMMSEYADIIGKPSRTEAVTK